MSYALSVFGAYALVACLAVFLFWVAVIRLGDTEDLDQSSLLVRWLARKQPPSAALPRPKESKPERTSTHPRQGSRQRQSEFGETDIEAEVRWLRRAVEDMHRAFIETEQRDAIQDRAKKLLSRELLHRAEEVAEEMPWSEKKVFSKRAGLKEMQRDLLQEASTGEKRYLPN